MSSVSIGTFYQTELMCVDHFRTLEIVALRNLKVPVVSTVFLRMGRG